MNSYTWIQYQSWIHKLQKKNVKSWIHKLEKKNLKSWIHNLEF